MARKNIPVILLVISLAVVAGLPHIAPKVHGPVSSPSIVGWGGSRLEGNQEYTSPAQVPSIIFPGENASDQEVLARTLVERGFNAIRVSFAPYCTSPNGFMSSYNYTRLERAVKIAATLGLWIIVDYHGYNDTFSQPTCWLNFWSNVTSQFKDSYS